MSTDHLTGLDAVQRRRRELHAELASLETSAHILNAEERRLSLLAAYREERRGVEGWVRRYARAAEDDRVEVPMVAPYLWQTVAASRVEWAERLDAIDDEIARLSG